MEQVKNDEIRSLVRENYGKVAEAGGAGCGCSSSSDCCTDSKAIAKKVSVGLGWGILMMTSLLSRKARIWDSAVGILRQLRHYNPERLCLI